MPSGCLSKNAKHSHMKLALLVLDWVDIWVNNSVANALPQVSKRIEDDIVELYTTIEEKDIQDLWEATRDNTELQA